VCRHLAYLGPSIPLATLLFDPPHSLCRQSWAPRDMRGGGTINADGFGVGWYPDGADPVRYRRECPLWTDADLPAIARVTTAGALLAAVRSATVGMPVTATAAAPFAEGRWLFSHNGVVRGWPDSVAALAARLPASDLLTLDAPTDSALLWALARHRLRAGLDAGKALQDTVCEVLASAPGSRLNLLLTDGVTIAATTVGHALSVRRGAGSVLLSSEPLDDDPAWAPVPDGRLVVASPSTVTLADLAPHVDMSLLPSETSPS
jgi:gamma-glutamyl hercynylcysteine S-oxide hydrolase